MRFSKKEKPLPTSPQIDEHSTSKVIENPLPTSPQIGPLREGLKLHRIISATKFFAWPVALPYGWGGGAREEQYSPFSVRFLAKKSSLFSGELDRIRDPERVYYYWQTSECQMNKDDQV